MAGNTFGTLFRLTTFGESHGPAIGGVIDGCPSNIKIDFESVQHQLDRRRPGQSEVSTDRQESDRVEFLSGLIDNVTTGTPIGFVIKNKDHRSKDYSEMKDVYRPSHADYTYDKKYGLRDYRGGGRSSARETACRVVAGAIAAHILPDVKVFSFVSQVGDIQIPNDAELNWQEIDANIMRCPHQPTAISMRQFVSTLKKEGDSVGGVISCVVKNAPPGLGEPVFDKLNAELGKAMLGINAVKGFEIGSGFRAAQMKGSEHNDSFNENFSTSTNNSGGIQGGISNGQDITFRVAFKPVATINKEQKTVTKDGEAALLKAKGRHDPCVVPRAVPIVDAMAYLVLADMYLRQKAIDNG